MLHLVTHCTVVSLNANSPFNREIFNTKYGTLKCAPNITMRVSSSTRVIKWYAKCKDECQLTDASFSVPRQYVSWRTFVTLEIRIATSFTVTDRRVRSANSCNNTQRSSLTLHLATHADSGKGKAAVQCLAVCVSVPSVDNVNAVMIN